MSGVQVARQPEPLFCQMWGTQLACLGKAARQLPEPVSRSLCDGLMRLVCDLQLSHGWREFGVCAHCGNYGGAASNGAVHCGLKEASLPSQEAARLCVNFSPRPAAEGETA